MVKLQSYMLVIISISILSLVLSIMSLAKENHVGRYQVVYRADSPIYIIDTETSRLFMRFESQSEENAAYYNLGTIEEPYSIIKALGKLKEEGTKITGTF